jgi:hypothetical protein
MDCLYVRNPGIELSIAMLLHLMAQPRQDVLNLVLLPCVHLYEYVFCAVQGPVSESDQVVAGDINA